MKQGISLRTIIVCTGSFLAFYMGAAFASGQELMQSFTSFGVKGYVGLLAVMALYLTAFTIIQITAQREQIEDPFLVFKYFCGEKLGQIFILVSTVLLAGNLIMMTASAGANLNETLGVPVWIGSCVVILAVLSVCMGIDGIVGIISKMGPIIGVAISIIAVIALVRSNTSFEEGLALATSLDIYKGGPTAGLAAAKYGFYCVFVAFSATTVCGNLCTSRKEAAAAAIAQIVALAVVCTIMYLAQIVNIEEIYQYQIPNLKLVAIYLPMLTTVFSILLLGCTYASSTIQLWTIVRKFAVEKTRRYYIVTVVIGIVVFIVSSLLPFSVILNRLFMCGYVVGPIFFICIVWKVIRR